MRVGGVHSRPPAGCGINNPASRSRPLLLLVAILVAHNAGHSHGQGGLQDKLAQVKNVRSSTFLSP
jgi:hypothetical protein